MVENEYEKIEQKLKEFLGIESGELREKIIEKAVCLDKDYSRMVVLRIYPDGAYDIGIGQEGNYDGLSSEERLWVEFSLIEPWDLPEFETIIENEDGEGYIDSDGFGYDVDDLLDAVRTSVASGFYDKFEYEWKKFFREFNDWLEGLEGERIKMNNLEKKIDKLLEERNKYLDMLYQENDWKRGERIKGVIEHLDNEIEELLVLYEGIGLNGRK